MTKTFDYNIGDDVWIMKDNKAQRCTITEIFYRDFISIVGFTRDSEESYTLSIGDKKLQDSFKSRDFYRTKEELLKSL